MLLLQLQPDTEVTPPPPIVLICAFTLPNETENVGHIGTFFFIGKKKETKKERTKTDSHCALLMVQNSNDTL